MSPFTSLTTTLSSLWPSPAKPPATFLDLPPELRNQIYTEILLSPARITIDISNCHQPKLLQVHPQIRTEAAPMYYRLNKFHFACPDFDPSIIIHFRQHSRRWLPYESMISREACVARMYTVGVDDGAYPPRNWDNLMRWMKAVHADEEIPGFTCAREQRRNVHLVFRTAMDMFHVARILRGTEWENVEKVLEKFGEMTQEDPYDSDDEKVDWTRGGERKWEGFWMERCGSPTLSMVAVCGYESEDEDEEVGEDLQTQVVNLLVWLGNWVRDMLGL